MVPQTNTTHHHHPQQQPHQQQQQQFEHEAGYDAYLTGHLFLRLLQARNLVLPTHKLSTAGVPLWCPSAFYHAFANRLFLWLSPMDMCLTPTAADRDVEWTAYGHVVCVGWERDTATTSEIRSWIQRADKDGLYTTTTSDNDHAATTTETLRMFLRTPSATAAIQLAACLSHASSQPPVGACAQIFVDYATSQTSVHLNQ
jgi:hypothetical protein